MFPTPDATIIRNEDGEVIGWDRPAEPDYCDMCGYHYRGDYCRGCYPDDDDD
jgi:hypothetical protein